MVSLMYWSNVGDRKNVQRPISAFGSTPWMTASAGSTASGVADGDAAGADGSVLAGAEAAGGCEAGGALLAGAAGPQAATARIAARTSARLRFLCITPPSSPCP